MQQVGLEVADGAMQPEGKSRADRGVKPSAMTGRPVDGQALVGRGRWRTPERLFVMHQRRRRDALELQRRQQIGQKVFDAAGKGRVILA